MITHTRRAATLAAGLAAALALAACSPDSEESPNEAPEPDQTEEVTEGSAGEVLEDELDLEDIDQEQAVEAPTETEQPAEVSTEVADLDQWVAYGEVAGEEPVSELHPQLDLPDGAELIHQQEAHGDGDSIVTDVAVYGLEDAKGVFDGLEAQLLESGWEYHYIDDAPTEIVEGDMVAWLGSFEDHTETIVREDIGGEFARWQFELQVVAEDGATFIKLQTFERTP